MTLVEVFLTCLFIRDYLLLYSVREKLEVTKVFFRCWTGSLFFSKMLPMPYLALVLLHLAVLQFVCCKT